MIFLIANSIQTILLMGPLLFPIYINDLRFLLKFATANHFADDTCIIYQSKKLIAHESDLNQTWNYVANGSTPFRLSSLNVDQTELLPFQSNKKKMDCDIHIKITWRVFLESWGPDCWPCCWPSHTYRCWDGGESYHQDENWQSCWSLGNSSRNAEGVWWYWCKVGRWPCQWHGKKWCHSIWLGR